MIVYLQKSEECMQQKISKNGKSKKAVSVFIILRARYTVIAEYENKVNP